MINSFMLYPGYLQNIMPRLCFRSVPIAQPEQSRSPNSSLSQMKAHIRVSQPGLYATQNIFSTHCESKMPTK
jgi:hypothetical protein